MKILASFYINKKDEAFSLESSLLLHIPKEKGQH